MTTKRRRRTRGGSALPQAVATASAATVAEDNGPLLSLPNWKWKTFPVYFALAAGLMVGVYAGWLAGFIAADNGNQNPTNIVFIGSALIFGFGLSKLTTRLALSRRWIKPRLRSRAKGSSAR